ncbi:MAG: transposase [Anaerolineae bacterium]|nr:transposase [Anaerolineae bacterium]
MPEKYRQRLEQSWAGVFYQEFFCRIDEEIFAELYADIPSRPNVPVNVLVGLDTLKAGFGWSDEQMQDAFIFDVQVCYALGMHQLGEGDFDIRTVYNFRRRVTEHMHETGENLIEQTFEQASDEQVQAYELKTGKLRMDSAQIASNIREMTRLQLLVEVLQRVQRMLNAVDKIQYDQAFSAYLKGSSGQYVYHVKAGESDEYLESIGELMRRLVRELASGLQSPDDWKAAFRQKRGQDYIGYAANATETHDPDNSLQLIVKVQVEPNASDDAVMLEEALPDLKARTDMKEMHNDGRCNSPNVDAAMRQHKVTQIQTAIRDAKPSSEKLALEEFDWEIDDEGKTQHVTCPIGQKAAVVSGKREDRYLAYFSQPDCDNCPLVTQCPIDALKRKPQRALRFSQRQVNAARRRKHSAEARASGQNLRAAVEAAMRGEHNVSLNQKGSARRSKRGLDTGK